jgi:hypothetical protein
MASLPNRFNLLTGADAAVPGGQRESTGEGGGANQPVPGIARIVRWKLVSQDRNLRVIGWIAVRDEIFSTNASTVLVMASLSWVASRANSHRVIAEMARPLP